MPIQISGVVFFDANQNGAQDPGEGGTPAVCTVSVSGPNSYQSNVQAGPPTGAYSVDATPGGAGQYTVSCTPAAGYSLTTASPVTVTLGADPSSATVSFGVTGRVCFRRGSSWVDRVCWLPGQGVLVQFKDRHGTPCFCCYYPGTTYADYLAFQAAPSLGHHVWLWYYWRPYVPLPVGS